MSIRDAIDVVKMLKAQQQKIEENKKLIEEQNRIFREILEEIKKIREIKEKETRRL